MPTGSRATSGSRSGTASCRFADATSSPRPAPWACGPTCIRYPPSQTRFSGCTSRAPWTARSRSVRPRRRRSGASSTTAGATSSSGSASASPAASWACWCVTTSGSAGSRWRSCARTGDAAWCAARPGSSTASARPGSAAGDAPGSGPSCSTCASAAWRWTSATKGMTARSTSSTPCHPRSPAPCRSPSISSSGSKSGCTRSPPRRDAMTPTPDPAPAPAGGAMTPSSGTTRAPTLTQKASLTVVAYGLEYGAKLAVGLVVTPVLVSRLGQALYGVFEMLGRLTSYIAPVSGRPPDALRLVVASRQADRDPAAERRAVGGALVVWLLLRPLAVPESVLFGMNLGYKRMELQAGLSVVGGLLTAAAAYAGLGLAGVSAAQLVVAGVTGLCYWGIAR